MSQRYVDADGHVMENAEELLQFVRAPFNNRGARNWIPSLGTYWYIVVYPGAALVLFVLGWNLIGDAFRDALDPKMRGK